MTAITSSSNGYHVQNLTSILTDECILQCFMYLNEKELTRASQTCRRWNQISKDRILWKIVNLSPLECNLTETIFEKLAEKNLKYTTKLNLGGIYVSFKILNIITKYCKELEILMFGRNCTVEELTKRRQTVKFPRHVKTLDLRLVLGDFEFLINFDYKFAALENIGIGPRSFSRKSLPYLFQKMPNVRIIDFTNCLEIDDIGIQALAANCINVESICLIGCRNVFGKTFSYLISNCLKLKTLLLRYLKIDDHILAQNFWRKSIIEEIDLSACQKITWQGLFAFLPQLRHVHYLNLSYCGEGYAVNDTVLAQMSNTGINANLKMLDFRWSFHITATALSNFLPTCKSLEQFGLYQSFQITAEDIADNLIHLTKIKTLEFGASFQQDLNKSQLIQKLLNTAKHIEVLSLINFTSANLEEDYKDLKKLIMKKKSLKRINFCDSSDDLVNITKEMTEKIQQVKITVKWECALPPPIKTLDSIIWHKDV